MTDRLRRRIVLVTGTAAIVAAATACGSGTATIAPAMTPRPSVMASATAMTTPSLVPSPSATSPVADPTAEPTAGPSYPEQSPLPAGSWTGLNWVEWPHVLPCDADTHVGFCSMGSGLFGWSKGYLMFATPPDDGSSLAVTATPWLSADGLNWRQGRSFDMTDVEGAITQVLEGPHGLVAVARSGATGLCGQYPIWIQGMWTSYDGESWTRVDLRATFGGAAVYDVSGGPRGFIADGVAADGIATTVWASPDARVWRTVTLPGEVMAAAEADNATTFGGGYVVAAESFKGCNAIPLLAAGVWSSPDGTGWSRSNLPASSPTLQVATTIYQSGRSSLLAACTTSKDNGRTKTHTYWTTTDGSIWRQVSATGFRGDLRAVYSFGDRAVLASWAQDWSTDVPPLPTILAFDTRGNLVALKQTGVAPQLLPDNGGGVGYVPVPNAALGPSGLVVTDGSNIWVGALNAG